MLQALINLITPKTKIEKTKRGKGRNSRKYRYRLPRRHKKTSWVFVPYQDEETGPEAFPEQIKKALKDYRETFNNNRD